MDRDPPPGSAGTRVPTSRYAVHGIRVTVTSESEAFLSLCDWMLGGFGDAEADGESLEAQFRVRTQGWLEPPDPRIPRASNEERLGTHEFREGEVARYKEPHFSVEYADGKDARVSVEYRQDRRSRIRSLVHGEPAWADLYLLFRLAVQEPLLMKLERRGAVILHASAVARDGKAILFVGLNGSGKSTLCASLLDRLDYVSDNFTAWDGRQVLGFPSALRLDGAAPHNGSRLPVIHGKALVAVDASRIRPVALPGALVFVSLGTRTALTPLSSAEALQRLVRVREMTHEFPAHSYLGTLAPPLDLAGMEELVRSVPAYGLVMANPKEARECVASLL